MWHSRGNIVNVNFGNQQKLKILEVPVSVAEFSVVMVLRNLSPWGTPVGRAAQGNTNSSYYTACPRGLHNVEGR